MTTPRAVLALCLLAALAACSPDFRHGMGGPPRTAIVEVDNPFYCPKAHAP